MANNVTADPGSGGVTFATDDISGIHYPVNKIALGGEDTANLLSANNGTADGGTLRVTLASDGTGLVLVREASDPKTAFASSVAVAPGGTANLDSSQIGSGKTGRLLQARASASVPWKAELQTVLNGSASSTLAVWFWNDPQPLVLPSGAISVAEDVTAGLDGFRIVLTNLDPADTADLYAFFVWDEV